jgi:hypothetical protein
MAITPNRRHKKPTGAEKKLEARRGDYSRMIAQKGEWAGYKRPGSNKK